MPLKATTVVAQASPPVADAAFRPVMAEPAPQPLTAAPLPHEHHTLSHVSSLSPSPLDITLESDLPFHHPAPQLRAPHEASLAAPHTPALRVTDADASLERETSPQSLAAYLSGSLGPSTMHLSDLDHDGEEAVDTADSSRDSRVAQEEQDPYRLLKVSEGEGYACDRGRERMLFSTYMTC